MVKCGQRKGFSLNENRDVQHELCEFEMIYSSEHCQTIVKVAMVRK